jgi:hypothetical protein
MSETQYADFDVDEEVRKVNEEIARCRQRVKAKANPMPEPAAQPEPATWAWVEKQAHDVALCSMALVSVGIVCVLFFAAFVIGTRFV